MLNNTGFDLWADGYDKSVGLSDENDRYPFAGYRAMMNALYQRVLAQSGHDVLDIGFGTGILTSRLYEHGCRIYGQDFSAQMLRLAQDRMPKATLFCGDFSQGLSTPLTQRTYDAIVATYSLHHLTDRQKVDFIRSLLSLLREGGCLYIGDVAFPSRAALEVCRLHAGDLWDADETISFSMKSNASSHKCSSNRSPPVPVFSPCAVTSDATAVSWPSLMQKELYMTAFAVIYSSFSYTVSSTRSSSGPATQPS